MQCEALREQLAALAHTKQAASQRATTAETQVKDLRARVERQTSQAQAQAQSTEEAHAAEIKRLEDEREALLKSITQHMEWEARSSPASNK